MKLWKSLLALTIAGGLLLGAAACGPAEPDGSSPSESGSPAETESSAGEEGAQTSQESSAQEDGAGEETTGVTAESAPVTLGELMERSDLVVQGTVTGADLLTLENEGGNQLSFREYHVQVEKVLRGSGEEGQEVAVRCLGGEEDQPPLEGIPILERDGEYVLFLDDVSGCCVFQPEDSECCQLQSGDQGVYAVDPEDPERFVSVSGRLRDQEDRIFTIGQLEEKLALVNQETPPDPMREVNELQFRLETGLKDQELSREEYDRQLEDLETPDYGPVLERKTLW